MNVQKNGPALRIRKVPEVLVRALLSGTCGALKLLLL